MIQIYQTEASECGLACLAMILSHYGYETDISTLRRDFSVSLKGATLAQIMHHANMLNFSSRPLRLDVDEIDKLQLPCILHWNLNHFIVLQRISKNFRGELTKIIILDPVHGERKLSLKEFSAGFTGIALELTPTPFFVPKFERKKVRLSDLTGAVQGFRSAVVKLVLLAFCLELFAISAPLFNQFIIDEIVVSSDKDLLLVLLVGFGLIMLIQNIVGLSRSWFLMRWSQQVSLQWNIRIFHHMLRLPVSFFEKRHVGDIVSKFSSINSIQSVITNVFVETVLDGFLAVLSLGMMCIYSFKLAAIAIIAISLYGVLRWIFYAPTLEASRGKIVFSSRENSHFLESLRAITAIKLFGKEAERIARWENLKVSVQNKDIAVQKINIYFKIGNSLIFSAENLLVLYFGATQVIQNFMTIGMLMAFLSYSATFTSKISGLIDVFFSFRMLSMHNERLADIALNKPEENSGLNYDVNNIKKDIVLKNIYFKYGEGESWVLENVSLTIPFGQSIALAGESGCGKTTLIKIILGLISPTRGEIFIGNISVRNLGLQNYRKILGTVMQDDVLLTGSIADNISFFDANVNSEYVEYCAKLAALHDDIEKMPMRYQTLVGDMGSSLSGGQKQRVFLARALYKQPSILALDEATSHLDIENEKKVNDALRALSITRIMVAHRIETINAADKVVFLRNGKIEKKS